MPRDTTHIDGLRSVRGGPPPEEPPARLATGVVGTLLGALGGVAFAAWEAALLGRAGLPVPEGELRWTLLALYAGVGALAGLIAGLARRTGPDWALATVIIAGGWLLSGKLGLAMGGAGGDTWAGPALLVPMAIAVGLFATVFELPGSVKLGGAVVAFVLLAVGLPMNLHLVGAVGSRLALLLDVAVVLFALVVAALAVGAAGAIGQGGVPAVLGLGAAVGAGLAWPVLEAPPTAWPQAHSDAQPPLVLVVIDTLRADHLGTYGYDRPTSPVLDRYARRGLVYTDASATAPWTLPSVASILTGQAASRHGAGVNPGTGNKRSALRPGVPLLPERLAEAGYVSAGITTNPWLTATFGFHRGFDLYDGAAEPAYLPAGVHPLIALGSDPTGWPLYRDAATVTDRALAFVEAQEHSAWFLLVHYMDVHGPHHPPEQDVAAVGGGRYGALVDAYDASIHEVDRELGRLLEALPRGARVVVTSDHGEQLMEKRQVGDEVPAGTRHGHTLYQEQLHVPLILWGPGIPAGRVDRPVTTLDIAHTLLVGAGLAPPERSEGVALREVAGGPPLPERFLHADSVRFGPEQQMVRQGRYKLLRWHGEGHLLFDLQEEPRETQAVQVQTDQDLQAVQRRLEAALPPVGLSEIGEEPPVGAEVQLLLERLGYLEPGEGP